MNKLLLSLMCITLTLAGVPTARAQSDDWPRTLPLEQGTVTIYTPQVDKMNADVIHYRAALAYRATADDEPVFGAGWFESQVRIDSSNGIVHPTNLKVTETRFPAGTVELQSELSTVLSQQSSTWNLDFTVDELEEALQTAEAESTAVLNLNTAPPLVIYRDHPALLVSMDGEPVLREIEDSSFKAVINTPYPLIFDGNNYYLNAASEVWYSASKATGPYRFEARPPKEVTVMVKVDDPEATETQAVEPITAANAPEIIVSTEPAELIVTEGPAAFVPLVDDLLVLQNSDDDVFMHVSSQKFYIVLAGRWYHAKSLQGPWVYQRADDLPTAFASIPQDSDQADSRVYVAGTQEAKEAVLDAQVPVTAAVSRGEVDIDVVYDGNPDFETIDGTDMVYADNTGSTVILSDGWYYLVEDGVWYISSSANGPWQVSDHRPARVSSILPTSPVYNVKYVYVYDSTPSVVYVGYTPGYTGSYVYHNTVFYGSGWYYQPWVSPYNYYPRHRTWGAHVAYNPWSGWSFGLSWGWGPFSLSYYTGGYWHNSHYWHHRYYGGWGPRGYRSRHRHHNDRYNRYGYNHRGNDRYAGNDYRGHHDDRRSDNRYRSNEYERHDNLYRDRGQRARVYNNRDNRRATPGENRDLNRQANYIAASNSRQQNNAAPNKGRKERTDPVSRSDLRLKARTRDTNRPVERSSLALNSRTQTSQTRKDNLRQKQSLSPVSYASAAPAKERTINTQRRSPVVSSSTRQTRSKKEIKNSRQTLSPTTRAPAPRSQSKSNSTNNRQHLSPATNTRINQQKAISRDTRSWQQPSSRANPLPAKRQESSRAGTAQRRPQSSSQKRSAPAKNKAPQTTGKQRKKSKGGDRRRN